ncbi:hypothetical protein Halha_2155 [Halobacteroides halobius DSM 5150]|uniref:Uncharacterized protein n=1 Tax=Halobacteroides halobius (strain ATCC 35273 / DSM 5150 / MD-1) TaxID=748449 RepID=L0KD68_HALHC|nr:hypothetical protein [Halobacteroides halobius]AGB42038.1 hypothetical protein Halha_2155 [Halobacteroides halobius DSM 5150]
MIMPKDTLSFINTENSFKYSVNIKFDIGDFEKLNNYVPTAKNIKLFQEIFDSFKDNAISRAHLLIGAYGTGKSLFGTVLGTILSNKQDPKKYDNFISKIGRFDNTLATRLEQEITEKDPYLIVLPTTDGGSFKQSMLAALQQALSKNGLEDIFPATYFNSIIHKLEQWEKDYEATYSDFIDLLEKERGVDIDEFKDKINNFDQESYQFFVNKYPKLTSGGEFNPFYGCNLEDIYRAVNSEIRKRGYQGIYVVFDEFNKLLERNVESFNSKELQDFAEMATRSGENEIHLLLVSHKKMVQYTTDLSESQVNEWKKVQERFKTLDATEYSSQIYELMSNVIVKEQDSWEEFQENNQENFEFYNKWIKDLNIGPDYNEQEKEEYILRGCYPLHPLTTILLPKLSQKIAQNERTIFTYLSTEEENTLGEFIKENRNEDFPIVKPSSIYDYFADLMQQELDYTQVHQAWADSERALQKIEFDEKNKQEFIKSLGIITAVNNFSEIPPSKEILKFALDHLSEQEFDNLVDKLVESKVILHRKSLDHFVFFEGSEIDFNKKIEETKAERENTFSPKYLLEENFKPAPIYPKEYNHQYKIRRYFVSDYFYLDELKSINDWDEYLIEHNDKNYEDGLIAYLLLESNQEIEEATKYIEEMSDEINSDRVIFVRPKKPLELNELLRSFDAQKILKEDKEFLKQDSLAEKELNAYITETRQLLDNKLTKFIEPYYDNALYYHQGSVISRIKSRRDISKKISEVCEEYFAKTPVINNELVVKNKISSPQKSARKDINNRLIFRDLTERLGIEGYRPNFLIYRTMLIKTKLLLKEGKESENLMFNPEILDNESRKNIEQNLTHTSDGEGSKEGIDENLKEIIRLIREKLYCSTDKVKFKEVYDQLRRPPYGLRLGIIPILLVIAGEIDDDLKHAIIRHNGEEREINAKLFERINKHPTRYTIEKTTWDSAKEEYILFLEELYDDRLEENNSEEVNRLKKLYNAIKEWYQGLPKYSRETTELSKSSVTIRKILNKRSSEVKRILLEIIPQKLLGTSINENNVDELKELITTFFKEHNQAYYHLINKLQISICNLFASAKNVTFKESLATWYQNLDKKAKTNTYTREINAFLNILRKLQISEIEEEKLLNEICRSLTGFDINDWNDKTVEDFLDNIKDIKEEVEGIELEESDEEKENNVYEFVLVDKDGEKYERRFEEVSLDGLSKVLENKIKSSFEDIGPAVSDREKQQVLINLMKDMFEQDGIV